MKTTWIALLGILLVGAGLAVGCGARSALPGRGGGEDGCGSLVCDTLPAPTCVSSTTLPSWSPQDTCVGAACSDVHVDAVGRVDLTHGSTLDIFGGRRVRYKDCVTWNRGES